MSALYRVSFRWDGVCINQCEIDGTTVRGLSGLAADLIGYVGSFNDRSPLLQA